MFIKISLRRACNKTILRNKSQVQGSSGEVKGGGITESIRLVLLYSRILRRPHKAVSIQFWMHLTDAGNPASLRSGKIPHCSAPVQIRGNPVFATIPVWEIPYRPPHIIRFQAMLYGRGPSAQFCAHAEIEAGASATRRAWWKASPLSTCNGTCNACNGSRTVTGTLSIPFAEAFREP
ncbi:hypothetical protein J2X54_000460 [Duganella sp. 3397]|nr:hypothetical protein [Duganella sp. 3397]